MAELIQYQLAYDANNHPHGGIVKPSKYVNAYVLTPSVAQTATIPTGAKFAMFAGSDDFYVNFREPAVIPAANVTNGAAAELNPTVRAITDYTSFSVIADTDCILTISYFS